MGIQVPPDSTGKVVETNSPDGSTQRQVVTVGDKTTAANTLGITATGAARVDGSGVTQPVSGTVSVSNLPATQPVSGSVSVSNFPATQPVSGTVAVSNFPATQVVDGSGVTQPVSGTVTANQGTANTVANAWPIKVTNGSNSAAVKAASTAAVATDGAMVVAVSPNNTVAVTQSGTWTVQPGNTANTTAWKVDGSAVTQPVSGTVTANAGTGTFATSDAADGTTASAVPAKAIYVGANKSGNLVGLTTDASGNLNINLANGTISGGNAAAGTTGAAVPGSADYTGFNSGGNLVGVSSSNPLPVTLANTGANATAVKVDGSAVTQPVSGTVTANQGGTWTVQPGNTANTTAWKVDGSAVTQPVSGTVTANQGGTWTARVVGNAGATLDAALTAGTAPTNGVAQLVQYNSTAPAPTNGQTVSAQSDIKGSLLISNEGRKATYSIAQQGLVPVAGAIAVTLYGSASKTVKVTRIHASLTIGTAALGAITINKYSTAVSAGTKTSPAMVPYDASDAAATATNNNAYTAAPTAGTLIGSIASQRGLMSSATVTGNCQFTFDFGGRDGSKPIILSGTSQGIALVLAGAASGMDYMVEWTEE
jgi:hypothetical protein